MGKGDLRTKKGKIANNSYGTKRPKKKHKHTVTRKPAIPYGINRIKTIRNKTTQDSNIINQAIFPILSQNDEGFFFIGTGFFINQLGWFITAKHVAIIDQKLLSPFIVVQVVNEREYQIREVKEIWQHDTADIIIGLLTPMNTPSGSRLDNPTLILKREIEKVKSEIFTYAYPDSKIEKSDGRFQMASFSLKDYSGKITSIHERNDIFLKGLCIQSNMLVKGGASGGPVFNRLGYVIAINTSGYDITNDEDPLSFLTPIQYAFDVSVPYNDGKELKKVKLSKMVDIKGVIVDDFIE